MAASKADGPPCMGWYDENEADCKKCLLSQKCMEHTKNRKALARQAQVAKAMASGGIPPAASKSKSVVRKVPKFHEVIVAALEKVYGAGEREDTDTLSMYRFYKGGQNVALLAVLKNNQSHVMLEDANGRRDVELASLEDAKKLATEAVGC